MSIEIEIDLGRKDDTVTDATISLGRNESVKVEIRQKVDSNQAKFIELSVDELISIHSAAMAALDIQSTDRLQRAFQIQKPEAA